MDLYLIRHAIAEESAPSGHDADRALTADGKAKMRRCADGLRVIEVRLDLILTSPYRRAAETAEIVAAALGGVETHALAELAAGCDVPALLAALRPYRHLDCVALVGHQPDLGHVASQVMSGSPSTTPLPFKKGGVACLEIPAPRGPLRGELEWFMTPKQLRALRES
ncbi:MAG TPA: phosphohistidine phosphatase SixA [Candidatus Binatia bacterium]|nr:phosphohistidine phosphatase SixA [Candidatus Binatia bacterium]